MKIFVPTKDRPNDQRAYMQLEAAELHPVLVVDKSDKADYSKYRHVRVNVKGIAAKRQACLEMADGQKFAMFDDDMTISAVDDDECSPPSCLITEPSPARVRREIDKAERLLNRYAHGGVHTRHFVNYAKKPFVLNRGYYRQIMFFNPAKMLPVPRYEGRTAEDVRFMLRLLDQGLDYFLLTSCCMVEKEPRWQAQNWSQEEKNADMLELAAEYPKFTRPTKDGRITLTYAGILKHAKRRLAT